MRNNEFTLYQKLAQFQGTEQTRLVDLDELQSDEKYCVFRYKDGIPADAKGPIVGSYRNANGELCVVARRVPTHTIIHAPTGGCKTQGFILNTTLNFNKNVSYIVTDVKGEITPRSFQKAVEVYGKDKVVVLNFTNPEFSMVRINPLTKYVNAYLEASKIKDAIKRRETLDNVVGELDDFFQELFVTKSQRDPSWENVARGYILSLIVAMLEDMVASDEELNSSRLRVLPHQVTFKTAFDIVNTFTFDYRTSTMDDNGFFSSREDDSVAKNLAKTVNNNASSTRLNYFGFITEFLKGVTDGRINQVSASNTFDFNKLAEEPMVLFIIYDSTSEALREWVNSLLSNALNEYISSYGKKGRPLDVNINFVIDEFPTLKPHASYINALTTGRGSNISLSLVVQSLSQLKARYPEEYETILQNCGIEICLGSNNLESAKVFIESLGKTTVASEEAYIANGTCKFEQRSIVTYNKLMHDMNMGEAFIRRDNAQPLHSSFCLYFKTKEYTDVPMVENSLHTQIVPDGEFKPYDLAKFLKNKKNSLVNDDNDNDDDDFDGDDFDGFDDDFDDDDKKNADSKSKFDDEKYDQKTHKKIDFDEVIKTLGIDLGKKSSTSDDDILSSDKDIMSYMFGVHYPPFDAMEQIEFDPNYAGKFCPEKDYKAISKEYATKYVPSDIKEFEDECMIIIENVVKLCPTRYIAIKLTEHYCDVLKKANKVNERLFAILSRASYEFRMASNQDYINLRRSIYNN